VELDEQSSYLTTIETPFGRYRWLVMPFGNLPAPEYFQQYLERNLEGLPGIKAIADDICLFVCLFDFTPFSNSISVI
jgi:hypothetical protein